MVATDKTGTLTESTLRLAALDPLAGVEESRLLRAALLASTARLVDAHDSFGQIVGDPIDAALLQAALPRGVSLEEPGGAPRSPTRGPDSIRADGDDAWYSDTGASMRTLRVRPRRYSAGRCSASGRGLAEDGGSSDWASDGFRVVAVAERDLRTEDLLTDDEIETDLVPLGSVALHDPPRETAAPAIAAAHKAGLRVEMLTGDHRLTALAIGRSLGLPAEAVHARVTPEEKLRLVERRQTEGEVVAVTGPAFYMSYGLVVGIGAAIVLIPGLPLIGILFVTQVVDAVLLLPLLLALVILGRDPKVLGPYRNRRGGTALACAASALVAVSLPRARALSGRLKAEGADTRTSKTPRP